MANFGSVFSGATEVKKTETHPRRETKWIHYTKLVDNSAQYCDEKDEEEIHVLASLIEADRGVLQHLLVRKLDADEFEIIAGHKRRRACKWLVEECGKKEYEFLPCMIECLNDVRAEFQLYSSNGHHVKTDYERMHELERMRYLLETYPEEFPHLQTGRMVERLAKQMNMKRSTVGEYLSIVNNLGKKGKEEFAAGTLKKSAAVELSALPDEEQEQLLEKGVTAHKDIKAYKEKKTQNIDRQVESKPVVKEPTEEEREVENQEAENQKVEDQEVENQEIEDTVQQTEAQLPGQLRVVNTDMQVEEENTYTSEYFLNEQRGKLQQLIQGQDTGAFIPLKALARQRVIVQALELLVEGQDERKSQ